MGAYGTRPSMRTLAEAMRDKAKQDTASLGYVPDVRVSTSGLGELRHDFTLFIVPERTVTILQAENHVRQARHELSIECARLMMSVDDEEAITGGGKAIGILQFADDVLDFFDGNLLGLTGLDEENPPIFEEEEATFGAFQLSEETRPRYLLIASLRYQALTRAFKRGG